MHVEKSAIDFAIQEMNLTKNWPVLMPENEWNASLPDITNLYHNFVDFAIGADLKDTSKRALYVSCLIS